VGVLPHGLGLSRRTHSVAAGTTLRAQYTLSDGAAAVGARLEPRVLAPIAIERLPEYWHPTTQRFATPSTFATADMTEEVTLLTTISEVSRPPLARSRVATSAIFVSFGLVLGTWAAHLPAVKDTIGASSSSMGTILLILGTGAFVGMQISGYVVDRFGSGRVAVIGAAAMAFALVPRHRRQ